MDVKRPFSAEYAYNLLTIKNAGSGIDRIGATLFNSKIKLTPHQIEASLFAFKSPLAKGTILADEVGLGKTIEAGIVLAQLWSEHKRKILIVAPASLMRQWASELMEKFNLPSIIMDRKSYNSLKKDGYSNPFILKDHIIICSYQMCAMSADDIRLAGLDLCIIDEAHKLRNVWTGKNVISNGIKNALDGTKKLLLTATPIQNNVMDLYGLSSLIDDNIFGDYSIYREKYLKNYATNLFELKERLGSFVHRTLREQVQPYIQFTNRIPKTYNFTQSDDEIKVYNAIRNLLLSSDDESYLIPKKQKHLLLLILCKLMGSSVHSIVFTLEKMKERLVKLLETGVDDGLVDVIDDSILDETDSDDINDFDDEEEIVIDKEKLKVEINNLTTIIETAKKVKVESKYLALRDAINYGFEHLKELEAEEKILIFTESRRTQDYLYQSLIADGYDEVIVFNGSNSDEKTREIYEDWCSKPENFEKLRNNKGINVRQAIIDYFKSKGKILIATEAGAEGLNMQFCSMVVNYDLPWNPQLVEQRIGRCHRFGQKHDVVVINFLSSSNVVEQRIYELLSTKFKVFNDVFGSSDSILGVLEDGVELQKSIIEIYTKCRTVEEINQAFDVIQEQYKEVIDESMRKTKRDLLENFDEDLQAYFADVLNSANKSIDKYEKIFMNLTRVMLPDAIFNEDGVSFTYNGISYCLSTKNDGSFVDYNMTTELGSLVIERAKTLNVKQGHIEFDITNYPFLLSTVQKLKGKKGYIALNRLCIDSFELEEYLFFNGMLEDGTIIDEDTITKLFRLESVEYTNVSIHPDMVRSVLADSEIHSNKILTESEERNNETLKIEIQRINKWAEDKIESTQLAVEQMRAERKNLQKQSDMAENSVEKEAIEEQILRISKRIKQAWLELADAEDDIEFQRKTMIRKLKEQLMKKSELSTIFLVSFSVV